MAIKEMCISTIRRKINYVVDADIKGFFDHMSNEWTLKFVEYYIKDPNILWLIKKYLKGGVLEAGVYQTNEVESAQGNIIGPVLANIYMHHVLVLWYKAYFERRGAFLVVYADDYLAGFEQKQDRLKKYGLEIETSKSRILEFGRYAKERRKRRPLTSKVHVLLREDIGREILCSTKDKREAFWPEAERNEQWLKQNRTTTLKVLMPALNRKLLGHYRYYGVTYNVRSLIKFYYCTTTLLYRWMNRRSQKKSYNWEGFKQMWEYYPLAYPKGYVNLYA